MPGMDNAYAWVVGIANYQTINPLPPTVLKDAQDIYTLLIDPNHCGYDPQHVRLLLDKKATGSAMRQALADLAARSDEEASVFVYLSSHGGQIESGRHAGAYILPADVNYTTDATIAQTAISGADFTAALQAIPARKVVVLFDCCHSGGVGQPKDAAAPAMKAGLPERYYERLKEGRGRVIMASSRSSEVSWVNPGAKNSLFTGHLLTGMRGGVASDDGLIRIFDLFEYVQPKVTADRPNQHPIFKAEIEENFAIALYLGGKKGVICKDEQGFRYDVYVSYAEESDRDADWVWETMLPGLEKAGLNVAISDDVREAGVSRVVSIQRGIQQSRRTLLVLSPAYLADQWGQFENMMAQTMGVDADLARIIPVIAEPFDTSLLPPRLSTNLVIPVDLTKTGRRGQGQFDRLVRALQGPIGSLGLVER
jgi:hypothetical protein